MDIIASQRTIRRRALVEADTCATCIKPSSSKEHPEEECLTTEVNNSSDNLQSDHLSDDSDISNFGEFNDELFNDESSSGSERLEDKSDDDIRNRLKQWVINSNTPHCHVNSLLAILKPHFSSLPKDARTLLQTQRSYDIEQVSGGQFHYFGLVASLKTYLKNRPYLMEYDELSLQFNVDGLPLFKSTSESFWPILALIKESDCHDEPFIIALWVGKGKPKDSNELMERFVSEMKVVENDGLVSDEKTIKIKIVNFICDTPARAFVKKTKGHSGYYACDFCVQEGEYYLHRMTYPQVKCPLRSDVSFNEMLYEDSHQTGHTILTQLNIGMVSQFPHDYMHLVCLGVVKKIIGFWISGPLNVRVGSNVIKII